MIYNCYRNNDQIVLVYSNDEGKIKKETINFKPSLYFPQKSKRDCRYTSIQGKPLWQKHYNNIYAYDADVRHLKAEEQEFYGDIQPTYQYIIQKFLHKTIKDDKVIQVYNYDIEAFSLTDDEMHKPEIATAPVQTITIEEMHTGKYYIYGYEDYTPKDLERKDGNGVVHKISKDNVIYIKCKTEVQLLKKFVQFLQNKVHILTGFNILNYDNQYITNRCRRLRILPEFTRKVKERQDGFYFPHMQCLDMRVMYKNFIAGELPQYSLDYICKHEIKLGKDKSKGTFRERYSNDFGKFIDYNIMDVVLVSLLEKKLKYITMVMSMASKFRCLPVDILSATRYWDNAIFEQTLRKNMIVDCTKESIHVSYIGGFVKQPICGKSGITVLYDVESSYPTSMRRFNTSPDRIVDFDKLPKELQELKMKLLYHAFGKIWKKHKNTYRTKSGSTSELMPGLAVPENKFPLLYLKDKQLDNIAYPHFFVIETRKEINIEKTERIKNFSKDKYLLYALSQKEIFAFLKTNKLRNETVKIFDHFYLSTWLTDYFVEDHQRFEKFAPLLKKYKLTITPILEFFKLTKNLGIVTQPIEDTFFERVQYKSSETDDRIIHNIAQTFTNNNLKIDKEQFIDKGIKLLHDKKRNKLIEVLKTKDTNKIRSLITHFKKREINDHINNYSLKIAINSAYGATAAPNFRYSDVRLSESITSCSQLALRGIAEYLHKNEYCTFRYSDTDSMLLSFEKVLQLDGTDHQNYKKLVKYLTDVVEPVIKEYYLKLKDLMNTRDVDIKMDREVVVKKAFFTGKKHYFWWLYEKDGQVFKTDKFKTRGLDTRRSSTPAWVSDKLNKFYIHVVKDASPEKLRKFVRMAKKKYDTLGIEEIGKNTSTGKLNDYEGMHHKGLLAFYKGAFLYNTYLEKYDKEKKFLRIAQGMKVKWIYIHKNNEFNCDALAVPEEYDSRVFDHFKIDHDKQFEKTFMSDVNSIFKACGWSFKESKKAF